jgi:Rho-binding antiterminator
MNPCTISCELHDYIEIACMYGYQVKLTLKDQLPIEGKAIDLLTTAEKREYLIIETEHQRQQIELIQLKTMQVLTSNAKFQQINFNPS